MAYSSLQEAPQPDCQSHPPARLRVLMLASFFPKPGNPLMGPWALSQAQALNRRMDLQVVSVTSWVPRFLGKYGNAAPYANCPDNYRWDSLQVSYPRVLWYPVGSLKERAFRNPSAQMSLAWQSVRQALRASVKDFQPHVLYAHHTAINGYFAAQLNRETGIPFVVTDHDFGEISACDRWAGRKRFFQEVVSRSSMMVSVASRMETRLKELFPGAPTCTIPNGTDPIRLDTDSSVPSTETAGKVVLFACGTFYERKAFPLLVEAFARVAPRFPDAILRIAGDGEQRPQVEECIRRFGLQERVQLLGFQPRTIVLQEMCQCDAFVLIGWDEPFATVYLEALAAGKPVICCNDGGITDVLQNEVHGLTVPPRDVEAASSAIARLLNDRDLRLRLGRAGAELFDRALHWDHNAARMEQIFLAALTDSKRAAPQ
jgi:glycosyltransferase involved in cell wall biosynthesis